MDTKLHNGGFALDLRGLPRRVTGLEELAQRAYIRLAVKKGSLSRAPQLGSELHRLPRGSAAQLEALATAYVREALAPLPLRVEEVACSWPPGGDCLAVAVTLLADEGRVKLEVKP